LGDGGRVEMQFGTGDFREEVRRAGDKHSRAGGKGRKSAPPARVGPILVFSMLQ